MIKLLISKCESESGLVQLITTTNDSYVMNGYEWCSFRLLVSN
jgi:hypothetical protein